MIIESLGKSCCVPPSKKRLMYDTCSNRAYHSLRTAIKCKEGLAFIFIRHRCLHFRLQTGVDRLVVVELASLVVWCGGHRPPTNNGTSQRCFDWKAHTSNTTCSCPHYMCLDSCVIWSRRGCTRSRDGSQFTTWTHHVSSWHAIITQPSYVVC